MTSLPGVALDQTLRAAPQADAPFGVIDIGSNSIRLVVFDRLTRVSSAIFNERVLCGLGRGLDKSGVLNADAIEPALETLRRFDAIIQALDVPEVVVVATAAVREASDGAAFVARVHAETALRVRVLSGEDEASYSAYGIASAFPGASGVVADLGGASLELVALRDGQPVRQATLPIGPLRFGKSMTEPGESLRKHAAAALRTVPWLKEGDHGPLFLVGGAWRSFGRMHMMQNHYPLSVLHHYVMRPGEVLAFADMIGGLGPKTLRGIEHLARKRLETVPFGAVVLRGLLKVIEPESIIFSAYGLREGLLFRSLPGPIQHVDPLHAACEDIANRLGRRSDYGAALAEWQANSGLFEGALNERLRHAACLLSEISWRDHPDFRVEHAFKQVVRAPFVGISHQERVLLAIAVSSRYLERSEAPFVDTLAGLVSRAEIEDARQLGLALRLADTLSSGEPQLLRDARLTKADDETLSLALHGDMPLFFGKSANKELKVLAKMFKLTPSVSRHPDPAD